MTIKVFVDTAAWADLVLGDAEFEKLKTVRDSLAHGDSLDVADLPVVLAGDLTQRYLNAIVAYQLSSKPSNP